MDEANTMGRSGDLEQLAQARFESLSESEIKMLHAAVTGTTAFCGPSQQDDDLGNDPADSDTWSADRQVRSDLIRWLCIDQAARHCVDPRGIKLFGASIKGALDLSFATVHFPLRLSRCRLSDDWNLNYIEIPSIQLTGTWVPSLTADAAKVRGSVILKNGFCAKGKVQLRGAQIGGNLDCGGSEFQNPAKAEIPDSGMALNAEGAKVGGSVFLRYDFSAEGEVSLFNAEIGGDLDCGGGNFQNPAKAEIPGSGVALNAVGAKVEGSVFLHQNFLAEGAVLLFDAKIGRSLDCAGGKFQNPANAETPGSGMALNAGSAKVGGSVFLRYNFSADGAVLLFGAEIGQSLDCGGGNFQNPASEIPGSGVALNAEGAKVGGSVFLRQTFSADGGVRLFGAEIGQSLDCAGGKFQNPAKAKIPGSGVALNAGGAKVGGPVFLNNTMPEGEVRLFNAEIGGDLDCGGGNFQNPAKAEIPGSGVALNAVGAKVEGSVFLRQNFSADGAVLLFDAKIGRSLDCGGGNFQNPTKAETPGSGMALNAGSAKVGGSVLLRHNFSADGTVLLFGAEIGQSLDCGGGNFQNPAKAEIPGSGVALNAEVAKVGGSVFLRQTFSADGAVRLFGAEIGQSLDCAGGKFQNPAKAKIPGSGVALNVENAKVGGPVFLTNALPEGEVSLFNAEIGGDLDCGGGNFQNPAKAEIPGSGVALNAESTIVGGSVFLRDNFSADGAVRLFGAEIVQSLDCAGGKFQNPANAEIPGSGMALNAEGAKIGGPVFLSNNFLPEGEVSLFNAEIGGNLDCGGSKFRNPANAQIPGSGMALNAEGAKVGGSVFMRYNFSADGAVRLFGAEIGRSLDCDGGKFQNPANAEIPGSGVALDARGIKIEGSMFLREEFCAVGTVKLANARITSSLRCGKAAFESLDLVDASVGSIVDDEDSWPKAGMLFLDGFVYGRISGGPSDAYKRLEWLQRQPSFARQPYRQLASILGNAGDDLGARRVLSKMERTAWEQRGRPFRLISHLLRLTIGYGYFPLRAVWLILTLVIIGSGVYWVAYNMGSIVPTQKESHASFEAHCYPSNEYGSFHAIPYSLENSFPLVKLGVQDKWAPAPGPRVLACSSDSLTSPVLQVISAPRFLRWFRWIQICLGWVLTTLFVGGVTGILRKG